jgi:pyrroline-5-carboxylate reductase
MEISDKENLMEKIGFIGAGNMAEALIKGIISAKLYKPANILISDIQSNRLDKLCADYKINSTEGNEELARRVDVLVLSVKPQNIQMVLEEIAGSLKDAALVVSIAAGITTARIQTVLGDVPIIRVMPNTPALIGQGAAALYATKNGEAGLKKALEIFSAVGEAVIVADEKLIDAVTAVSGSGPAYFFLLAEEMIKAGVELGLSRDLARDLVLQTAKGAALLAQQRSREGESVSTLRRKVTSPGGTTEAALKVFENDQFSATVLMALQRAAERSRQLSGK